jgi:hypothetical protein
MARNTPQNEELWRMDLQALRLGSEVGQGFLQL